MADVKNPDEPTLPIKRPTETTTTTIPEPKKPKLHSPQNDVVTDQPNPQQQQPQQEQQEQVAKDEEEEEQQQEEEEVNGKDVIDRKGKGILIEEDDDEEDEDGDDDDDSDSDSDSGIGDELSDGSDFADDPLAEVDLDNILPSRTRRKTIHPGVYLANDIPPEDSDDSDDPDA